MLSVTPEFVADIRPGQVGSKIGSEWIEYQGEVYFSADDGTLGTELWKTDGTEQGTQLVKDIYQGEASSNPGIFVIFDELLYFRAEDESAGIELWRTDGTTAGTERFLDSNRGADHGAPRELTEFQGELYFSADDGNIGSELYRTDGTVAGTYLVEDIYPGRRDSIPGADSGLIEFAGWLYFSAHGVVNGQDTGIELYRTNGSVTELVLDADMGTDHSLPTQFTVFKNDLYFVVEVPIPPFNVDYEAYLYRVDGETGEVEQFFAEPVDFREQLTVIGDTMYFAGGGEETGIEVYRTDGTVAGTQLVLDVFPGEDGSGPENFFAFGDKLFFSAGNQYEPGTIRVLNQLWVTQGTADTTRQLTEGLVRPDVPLVAYRNEVYFLGHDEATGWELHKSDGTIPGTGLVEDIRLGQDDGWGFPKLVFDDELIFLANDGQHGVEIWTWDGTSAELAEVHLGGGDFTQEPELFQFAGYERDLLFSGSTPFEGDELFILRSQGASTIPGDADGNGLVEFADFLILSSNFGRTNATNADGDFDGSGTVDFADFLLLSANFGKQF